MENEFWKSVRGNYDLPNGFINLENGYYCPMPRPVLESFFKNILEVNRISSYYMRNKQIENKDAATLMIAKLLGCKEEKSMVLTRNTTESLGVVLNGIKWKKGDELILSCLDYGSMRDISRYLSESRGVKVVVVDPPLRPSNDDQILTEYKSVFNKRTKYLLIPHIIHLTGQIMPIKKICDSAHDYGIKVIVDGAHAVGQINFKMPDLNCDIYASSLHKWLSCPLGVGMLWMQKEMVSQIDPLIADYNYSTNDINKLNHMGTYAVYNDLTIRSAIEYYHYLKPKRKENRLRSLTRYWMSKLSMNSQVILNTPIEDNRFCAIGNFQIKDISPNVVQDLLLDKYKIWTVAINEICVKGIRVTVNVYNTFEELDVLVNAINEITNNNTRNEIN